MAGANTQKKDLSDGELSDDDGGEGLDTSICKTCNLMFPNSKAFYHHIYSVSHLQKTSNLANSSEPVSVPSAALKSSFPIDALYVTKPFSSSLLSARRDVYEDASYDVQSDQWQQFEPLFEGRWIMGSEKFEESGMIYSCETCGVSYKEKLMIDLHLAGLRHMKNVETADVAAEAESSIVESSCQKMNLNDMVERNVDLFKQLNRSPEPEQIGAKSEASDGQEKKLKVADILSRNFNAYQKLSIYVEPVLGVDYISEFRFSNGCVEHVCNLCEVSLSAPVCLTEHASSLQHLLRFIFYHDSSSFRLISLADKCADLEFVRNVAADIESKQGRQLRTRVFVETTVSPSAAGKETLRTDSASTQWVEQKDDLIRPISALPGHSANATYAYKRPPDETTQVTDMQSLLDSLANQSCVASGKPPSTVKPVSRMNLLSSLAAFDINNDSDAEVSLQIANALTLALLSYRMTMMPSLKPNDRTKLEQKLVKLREEAELVAEKTRGRGVAVDQDSMLP